MGNRERLIFIIATHFGRVHIINYT